MRAEDAEEFTRALGQIVSGSWRQIALAKRLGVPEALGLTTEQWVNDRLGGYVKRSLAERRTIVNQLVADGHSNVAIAEVLGVDEGTIRNDRRAVSENSDQTEIGATRSSDAFFISGDSLSGQKTASETSENSEINAIAALAANDAVQKQIATETKKVESEAKRIAKRNGQQIADGCSVDDLHALIAAGKKFSVIYADPPWSFKVYSGKGKQRSADRHYDTASLDEIMALPIGNLAADDCALFLWCVMPELPGALDVIYAWGFTYKTVAFVWVKTNENDTFINRAGEGLHWGMGYWTRANAELCLLATKGAPKRADKGVHQVIVDQVVISPVAEHSRKPDKVQQRIEQLLGPASGETHLELFARRTILNWTVWGNQISRSLFTQNIPQFNASQGGENNLEAG